MDYETAIRGPMLRKIREAQQLTAPQLAQRTGLTVQKITRLENAKTVHVDNHTLEALRIALDL
jgi:transcriptional regulator with XRE-family HTH domain